MDRIIATRVAAPLCESGLPEQSAWEKTCPVMFCRDWRGQNPDPQRETQVQLLWSDEFLFVKFLCRYRGIYVYESHNSRRDKLWMRDVAEIFIRPGTGDARHYREFEIGPNGDYLDLAIAPGEKTILNCDLRASVHTDASIGVWSAELAIPLSCLTSALDPNEIWRANLFRIEGSEPDRFYSAWQPTHTIQPNFHVPEAFGELSFGSENKTSHN